MQPPFSQIIRDGLWSNNVVFAQLLALCPLLAVTTTATNGLGMGLASCVVMMLSNLAISLLRNTIPQQVRIPIYILVIASLVTLVDLAMNAWLHEMHRVLGLFIPLIVTNCMILGRAEAFAARQRPFAALLDGLMMGLGFTWVLVLLGGVREILGSGTLFANAELLLGSHFAWIDSVLFADYTSVLILLLPPGGFLVLGFLLAGKRLLERQSRARRSDTRTEQRDSEPLRDAPLATPDSG